MKILLIVILVLIFPIFIDVKLDFDKKDKKLRYNISVFKIKILNGYITIKEYKICIRINGKYKFIALNKIFQGIGYKFKVRIVSIKNKLKVSMPQKTFSTQLLTALNIFNTTFLPVYMYNKQNKSINNDILILEEKGIFMFEANVKIVTNVIFALAEIIKYFLWKLKNGIRKQN